MVDNYHLRKTTEIDGQRQKGGVQTLMGEGGDLVTGKNNCRGGGGSPNIY